MCDENKVINMVTLYLSCKNLPNLDYGSETDPFIRVYIREDNGKEDVADSDWNLLGQTETQQNVLNPQFTDTIKLNYYFQRKQIVKFECYNADAGGAEELVGKAEALMSEIMSEKKSQWKKDFKLPDQQI